MARAKGGNAGCLGLFVIFLPFWWAYDKCTGGDERRAAERIQAESAETARQASYLADRQRAARVELEQKAAKERAAAALREAQKVQLATWKPAQRAQALQQCLKDECPEGVPDGAAVIEAAKSEPERKQLRALKAQLERAQARAEKAAQRANASLRCCDGSDSPSCTCGNPRRGCCSHHGGVCGCSADAP